MRAAARARAERFAESMVVDDYERTLSAALEAS
jgi:hypothetical protein